MLKINANGKMIALPIKEDTTIKDFRIMIINHLKHYVSTLKFEQFELMDNLKVSDYKNITDNTVLNAEVTQIKKYKESVNCIFFRCACRDARYTFDTNSCAFKQTSAHRKNCKNSNLQNISNLDETINFSDVSSITKKESDCIFLSSVDNILSMHSLESKYSITDESMDSFVDENVNIF
jgi:hypothetical protein